MEANGIYQSDAGAPAESIDTDLVVIGAGSGGLSVAAGAAQMGARVVLFEKSAMGGDCLNTGCVPSKALLAAGHAAQTVRDSGRLGVNGHEPAIDFARVHEHVHSVIAAIAPHDSVERFESLGVRVIQAAARFEGKSVVTGGGVRVRAKKIVIATGSSAALPPVPGIDSVPVLTNESIFNLTERPEHLVIIGGGPIGIEMAQAHRRLGARVTVLEAGRILAKDDEEAVDVVRQTLMAEGINLIENAHIENVLPAGNGVAVLVKNQEGRTDHLVGTHLLVAVGRRPNVAGLNLEAAGIEYASRGIAVDERLRTSNKRVFAIGDVIGGYQFTHMAAYHAGIVIRNALFWIPAKVNYRAVPWVTYADPELAQVGLNELGARARHGDSIRVLKWALTGNDRALAEKAADGFVKIITSRKGQILGVTIVGKGAGELITPWVLAMERKLKIGAMASFIAPYPTFSEASKRAAGSYYTETLFGPRTQRLVKGLLALS